MRFGPEGGAKSAKVVERVAVQKAGVVLEAAVGVQTAALPSAFPPFLNCTVPVGPTPLLMVETVAVKVTLPPEAMLVGLATTAVVVAACVMVIASGDELLALKLLSPRYAAARLWAVALTGS